MARPKQVQPLQTIRAQIVFSFYSWPEAIVTNSYPTASELRLPNGQPEPPHIDFGDRRYIKSAAQRQASFSSGSCQSPRFWQEVRQLAFAFDDNDWPRIRGFYRQYGPLGDPFTPEAWGWAKGVLGWFRALTVLVAALKDRRERQLREYFPAEADLLLYTPQWQEGKYALQYTIWRPWHIEANLFEGPALYEQSVPPDIYTALWYQVARSVAAELNRIRLSPTTSQEGNISFAFYPQGAFQAAFLQWYFEELAGVDLQVCAADGCTNLVPPSRRLYCSPQCMRRMKQKRHRARKQ